MSDLSPRESRILRLLVRGVLALAALAILIYPADWAVWRLRVAFGGGMGTASVSRFTVAELKGNKEEYYPDGTDTVACSRSIFDQGGSGACWQLRRNPEIIERY
jgi:hypothetical protein